MLCQKREREKNGCVERIFNVEHASFTPLVFTIQGGMSREAHTFYNRLSDMIANKRKEPTSVITNWIRTKLNFALLKSCLLCLRGSRTPWNEQEILLTLMKISASNLDCLLFRKVIVKTSSLRC